MQPSRLRLAGETPAPQLILGQPLGRGPFGGSGLSGTGPKAGGPNYLARFSAEQTLTVNTAAVGGNVSLLTDDD